MIYSGKIMSNTNGRNLIIVMLCIPCLRNSFYIGERILTINAVVLEINSAKFKPCLNNNSMGMK